MWLLAYIVESQSDQLRVSLSWQQDQTVAFDAQVLRSMILASCLKLSYLTYLLVRKLVQKFFTPSSFLGVHGWELTQACVEDVRVVPGPLGTSHPISSFQIHSIGIFEDILSHKVSWQVFCMGLIYNETTTRVGG